MKNKIRFFFKFLINPNTSTRNDDFFYLLEGAFVLLFPSILIFNFLMFYFSKHNENVVVWNAINLDFKTIIFIALLSPLFEELIFRLPLLEKKNLIVSAISGVFYAGTRFYFFNKFGTFELIFLGLSGLFLMFYFFKEEHLQLKFYLLNTIFAFLHLVNFQVNSKFFVLYFFAVFNYLLIGFVFSYYRIHYGIKTSILMHTIYNLSAMVYIFVQ